VTNVFDINTIGQFIQINADEAPSHGPLLMQLNRIDRDTEKNALIEGLFPAVPSPNRRPLILILSGQAEDMLPTFPLRIAQFELEELTGSECDYAGILTWPPKTLRTFVVDFFARVARFRKGLRRSAEAAELAQLIAGYGKSLCFTLCLSMDCLRRHAEILEELAQFLAQCPCPEGGHHLIGVICIEHPPDDASDLAPLQAFADRHGFAVFTPAEPIPLAEALEWVREYNANPLLAATIPFIPEETVAEVYAGAAVLRLQPLFTRLATAVAALHAEALKPIRVVLQNAN